MLLAPFFVVAQTGLFGPFIQYDFICCDVEHWLIPRKVVQGINNALNWKGNSLL